MTTDKQKVVCPSDQVFAKQEFNYLLTIGGDLVEDEKEYDKFRKLLESIGETEFYICENLGATVTDRNTPFKITVNQKDEYKVFQEKVREFEAPFGWTINHFFIYGQNENWGIYICEFPTINIIGCEKNLVSGFREVFSINGNGYIGLKEFIEQEFQPNIDQFKKFKKQYRLKD